MASGRRASRTRAARPQRGRALVFGAVAVLALLVLWTGFRLLSARSDLAEAQRSAQTLRTTLTSADASSDQALSSIQASVASAKSDLNDPVVVIASKVPILGRNTLRGRLNFASRKARAVTPP